MGGSGAGRAATNGCLGWEGAHIDLTALQFRIMEILVVAAGVVVTFEELSRRVWGDSFDDREWLIAHIRRIRKRLGRGLDDRFIVTARGQGFRLQDPHPVKVAARCLVRLAKERLSAFCR